MEVPPLPPKMRPKPQRRGKHGSNIGEGKLYADEEAFKADADKWEPGELRVKVMLYRRCDVRVRGKVLGYAVYGNPVHRIDTCPCSECDTVRRTEVWSMQAHGPRSWSQFGDA